MTEIERLIGYLEMSIPNTQTANDISKTLLTEYQKLEKNLAKSKKAWKERKDVSQYNRELKEGFDAQNIEIRKAHEKIEKLEK